MILNDDVNLKTGVMMLKIHRKPKQKTITVHCNSISQYYCIFDQINAELLSLRNVFQKL